jgi:hypothetical protein
MASSYLITITIGLGFIDKIRACVPLPPPEQERIRRDYIKGVYGYGF